MRRYAAAFALLFFLVFTITLSGCAMPTTNADDQSPPLSNEGADNLVASPEMTPTPSLSPAPTATPTPSFYFQGVKWGSTPDIVKSTVDIALIGDEEAEKRALAEYHTLAYKATEIYGQNTFTVYGFNNEDTLCFGVLKLFKFSINSDLSPYREAYDTFLTALIAEYGEPNAIKDEPEKGEATATWNVDGTRITLTQREKDVTAFFSDYEHCPFTSFDDLVAYNTEVVEAAEKQEKKIAGALSGGPKDPLPLVVSTIKIMPNSIGTLELYVTVENISEQYTIDAFDFAFKCYDAYGDPISGAGSARLGNATYQDSKIPPGKKSSNNHYWSLFSYNTTKRIEVAITRAHAVDDTTWDLAEEDYTWVEYTKD